MAKRASRFGSNVTADIDRRQREGSAYGYLKLPQGVNVYKESSGKHHLDIIPYIVTDENHMDGNPKFPDAANPGNPWYKKPILVHRSVGADNQSVICPRTIKKKCPVCEHRSKQQSEGVEKGDLIDKAQLRNLYVVIPIGHKEYEKKFHVWDISNGNFQKKLDEELSDNRENGSFPDPAEGKTLEVRFSEETFNKNKYFEATRIDFHDREGYEDEVMEKAPNLDEMISVPTYKELEAMFLGLEDEEGEEEQEVQVPRRKKVVEEEEESHPFRKKKSLKEEPEAEEEEEQPKRKSRVVEEEEEEEAPAPVPKRKSVPEASVPKKKIVDEDEEESPPPLRRKAPSPEPVAKSSNGKCPFKHEFGKDWDGYDDCDDCPVFKECGAAHKKK